MIITLSRIYSFLRILSIDVVVGGLASGAMAAKLMNIVMPWIWWVAFPLSIWVIYTADHLLDAYRLKDQAHTSRHLFHHHHFLIILVVWLLCFISSISWIAWLVPKPMLYFAVFMGTLVLIHLSLVKLIGGRVSWMFHKELGVGFIYAVGVWGGPVVTSWPNVDQIYLMVFVQFFILSLINLLIFSMYEIETDKKDGHTSFVRAIGKKKTKQLIAGLAVGIVGIGLYLMVYRHIWLINATEGIFMFMLAVLLLIMIKDEWFRPHETYRILGDGVFMFSWLIYIC